MAEELLSVTNLSVSFRMYQGALTHTLVAGMHDVNLHLNRGEILAVVGASGSGKSLLAHAVLGILPYNAVTSGEMRYRGELLDAALQEQLRGRAMALIPQSVTYLDPLMRVGEEVCGLHGSPVDMAAMQESANYLVGLHDFAAFCKARPNSTTVRDLQSFTWHDVSTDAEPQLYEAHVTADAFCWSMVRSLVGACLAVGEGRRQATFAELLLAEKQRSSLVPVAAAKGLTLVGVDYPVDDQLAGRALLTRNMRDTRV